MDVVDIAAVIQLAKTSGDTGHERADCNNVIAGSDSAARVSAQGRASLEGFQLAWQERSSAIFV
jgi:hypothetical protein